MRTYLSVKARVLRVQISTFYFQFLANFLYRRKHLCKTIFIMSASRKSKAKKTRNEREGRKIRREENTKANKIKLQEKGANFISIYTQSQPKQIK